MEDTEASSSENVSLVHIDKSTSSTSININNSNHYGLNKETSISDQEQLQKLNLRFAKYIEKVRSLEKQNQKLVMKVDSMKCHELSHITEMYEEELYKLRKQVELQTNESSRLEVERNELNERLHQETLQKEEAQRNLTALKMNLDVPILACKVLENQIRMLQEEKEFQKKIHEEKIRKFQEQIKEKSHDEVDTSKPNLADTLRDVKKHYEDLAKMNKNKVEELCKSSMDVMNQKMSKNTEELNKTRQDFSELTLQNRKHIREIESLKVINDSLKKQIEDLEGCHIQVVTGFQTTIISLETQVATMTEEKVHQEQEYHTLQGVKAQLDDEIAVYRKLLEGEESRIKSSESSNTIQISQGLRSEILEIPKSLMKKLHSSEELNIITIQEGEEDDDAEGLNSDGDSDDSYKRDEEEGNITTIHEEEEDDDAEETDSDGTPPAPYSIMQRKLSADQN